MTAMTDSGITPPHVSVLYQQIITALRPKSSGVYVDGTVGAGGHAWGILKASLPAGKLLGLDIDDQALQIARERLSEYGARAVLKHASYAQISSVMQSLGWDHTDGIVVDLGVSSMQIDSAQRGFSFLKDGPLDMRFDPSQSITAADIVNTSSESDLAALLWQYGDEVHSRRIARAIVAARPFTSTLELANLIAKNAGKPGKIHPATRSFQALRIATNQELASLSDFLPQAVEALAPGGRLAVISFHSLEDRIVKQFFRLESRDCICPPEQPVCTCNHKASIIEISRHPIEADEEEKKQNPRSRSAKLRVIEKK